MIKMGGRADGISHSYKVMECPLYEKDLPRSSLWQAVIDNLGPEEEA